MSDTQNNGVAREVLSEVTIMFSGDSGDGIQVVGNQFASASSALGNDTSSFPDFPAEIRAPAGTLAGVSGFQLRFSSKLVQTEGDSVDVLVVMNPAALKQNIAELKQNGILIVNIDGFKDSDLKKAGYTANPLETEALKPYRVFKVALTSLTLESVAELGLNRKKALLCKNMFALGIACWLFDRPLEHVELWLKEKFGSREELLTANKLALNSGYNFADTMEMFGTGYTVPAAQLPKGQYRHITGNEALALGAVATSMRSDKSLFFASYPITPSSDVLHYLAKYKNFGVKTFQSEDEIAAISAAIGAAFAGDLALTSTSGPGLDLKQEAIGLAVMTELPVVIMDIQRGGPSTGLPTKTEQSDLLSALFGRHGECVLPVLAAASPGDCFYMIIEAFRLAIRYMTPVVLLSDGYIANSAEPWQIPDVDSLPEVLPNQPLSDRAEDIFTRDPKTLARSWIVPGMPGFEHRVGGIEKDYVTGNVSYDPDNHQKMTDTRLQKVQGIRDDIPALDPEELGSGDLLVLSWGSTFGAVSSAVEQLKREGLAVQMLHLRYLYPFQNGLKEVLSQYKKVLIPELNLGQLNALIRAEFLLDTEKLSKVQGRPFKISEIYQKCKQILAELPA